MKKTRDIAKLRCWYMRRREERASVSEICTAAQIPRRTSYNWWSHYQQHGLEGPKPRSKAPHTVHRTSQNIAENVIALRREKGCGPQLMAITS